MQISKLVEPQWEWLVLLVMFVYEIQITLWKERILGPGYWHCYICQFSSIHPTMPTNCHLMWAKVGPKYWKLTKEMQTQTARVLPTSTTLCIIAPAASIQGINVIRIEKSVSEQQYWTTFDLALCTVTNNNKVMNRAGIGLQRQKWWHCKQTWLGINEMSFLQTVTNQPIYF